MGLGRLTGAGDRSPAAIKLGSEDISLQVRGAAPLRQRGSGELTPRRRTHTSTCIQVTTHAKSQKSNGGQSRTFLVPRLHGHAQVPCLNLPFVHGEGRVLAHEAGDDVGATCDNDKGDSDIRGLTQIAYVFHERGAKEQDPKGQISTTFSPGED